MRYKDIADFKNSLKGIVNIKDSGAVVSDASKLISELIDKLIFNSVFNENKEVKGNCRWLIKSSALNLGIRPASIQELYEAMGRGEYKGFTVPAVNIRGLSYDVARAMIRAARKNNNGTFIFEIAKSEIGYTEQPPSEYVSVMIAAALKEGYSGPVFIQGDHYQVSAKKYAVDKDKEIAGLKKLINNYLDTLKKRGNLKGISKISIQTGTTHGGVPLPDGTVAKVKLDFDTLSKLSKIAREEYGLCGAVQHGASTLPDEAFDRFPNTGTGEVHLATGFQNMIYESRHFPK